MSDGSDPFALNVQGVTDLVQNRTNKIDSGAGDSPEGPVSEKYDAFELKMSDEELLKLRGEWEKKYASYEEKHKRIVEKNLESYLGKKANGQWLAGEDNIASNIQFEAEETFLSAALAKNPEPVVWTDNTPEGNEVATSVKTMLAFHSDQLALKRKLGFMVRQWSINHLGVLKPGWNKKTNDVDVENRKIQDFIFDTDGYVDAFGNFVGYLGERISVTAEKLIDLYPTEEAYIVLTTDGKLGTEVVYTEWWTDEYCFITYKEKVLDKFKNPYFKYPEEQEDPSTGEPVIDPISLEPIMTHPSNHFAYALKPYIFLSVFSLQDQPHDVTGLVEQNIPNQKLITKRTEQIDLNASSANNSYAFSEDNFNQETAKQAANARRKGNPILIPSGGPIDRAILPLDGQPLSAQIIEQLTLVKDDLRTSWGVQGITAQPSDEDQTARGMILNQAHDSSRIGGGIGSAIEQVADLTFNWLVQLYVVFYDETHFAAIMGNAKAVEYVQLSSSDLNRQLIVSVAPDSLRPRDEITTINLAQALFDKGAIGPKTLLTMVDFPDPDEAAADGVLYKLDPMAYFTLNFPEYAQKLQQHQQQMAQEQAVAGAQAEGMKTAAVAANTPPEIANGEPPSPNGLAQDPASAGLSQVQLPPV
jgi:hypothetical protein